MTVSLGECQDQSQLGGETSSPWDPTCQCCQRSSSCSQPSSLQRRGGTCPGWRCSSCWSSSSLRIWIGSEIGRESSEDSERSEVSHSHLEFSDIPSNSPSKFYFLPAGSSHRCWRGINCITDCGFKRLGWVAWQPPGQWSDQWLFQYNFPDLCFPQSLFCCFQLRLKVGVDALQVNHPTDQDLLLPPSKDHSPSLLSPPSPHLTCCRSIARPQWLEYRRNLFCGNNRSSINKHNDGLIIKSFSLTSGDNVFSSSSSLVCRDII